MSAPAELRVTLPEFLVWELGQDRRHGGASIVGELDEPSRVEPDAVRAQEVAGRPGEDHPGRCRAPRSGSSSCLGLET